MFYNTNSSQLRGDLVPPNMLMRNPEAPLKEGINRNIAEDQSLYPIRPTPGVNRGYLEDFLDEEQKLKRFTAACGPVIYRGNQYPEAYSGNAFVCEPAANLIKRNILQQEGPYLKATQAYAGREFLASKDERFRPVNLYNAPDGSLYVVDMYRGIIQDKVYLTKYLEDQINQRNLVKPLGMGRIYRIAYKKGSWFQHILKGNSPQPVDLHKATPKQLVSYLSHPNGWWRDTAQRLLVEGNHWAIVPELQKLLKQGPPLAQIHALWTLEGMGIYDPATIRPALASTNNPEVLATAIRIADRNAKTEDFEASLALYKEVLNHQSSLVQLQLALSLGEFIQEGSTKALHMLAEVTLHTQGDSLMNDAIFSSVYGKEEELLSLLQKNKTEQFSFISYLQKSISKGTEKKANQPEGVSGPEVTSSLSLGKSLYESTCSGCHQKGGEGLVPIAPPLKGSQWVTGPADPLISLILHGLKGPVTVNGKVYQEPEVQPYMPGFKDNPELTDAHIAAIINYMRKAWSSGVKEVSAAEVKEVRARTKNRSTPYTEKELIGTAAPN